MNRGFIRQLFLRDQPAWCAWGGAVVVAVAMSLFVYGLETITVEHFSNLNSFLILAVLLSAVLFGTGPALLTAVLCSLLYDWMMVPPFFEVGGYDNLIKFSVFVVAALLTGGIAGKAKTYAVELSRREKELSAAYEEREMLREAQQQEIIRREVETLRNAILTSVSHDLKTPLSAIIGAMSSLNLSDRDLSDGDRRQLVDSVLSEANRLLGFINNILEVARLENRDLLLKSELITPDDVVDLALKRLAPQLRRFDVECRQDGEDLFLLGDERLLSIAVGNLLDNAMKYSPAGTRIRVLSAKVGNAVRITVEDQGTGIPAPLREQVFHRWHRARQADSGARGTGLGLWITRRIVEAHSGTVSIADGQHGRGTRVNVDLPAAAPPAAAAA
jgi:two-component system sensor histidine kinase KdpD